jgi:hypothetical protein
LNAVFGSKEYIMKRIKPFCFIAILAAGLLSSEAALAGRHHGHGGHIEFGLNFGIPYSYPYPYYPYYAYPYYSYPYYPPVVSVPATPPVYIEQDQPSASEGYYWYHCDKPKGYYPYVKRCPGGWQEVVPEPTGP